MDQQRMYMVVMEMEGSKSDWLYAHNDQPRNNYKDEETEFY